MRYLDRFTRATEKYDAQFAIIMCLLIMGYMDYYGRDFFALIGTLSVICVGSLVFLLCLTVFRPGMTYALKSLSAGAHHLINQRRNRNLK